MDSTEPDVRHRLTILPAGDGVRRAGICRCGDFYSTDVDVDVISAAFIAHGAADPQLSLFEQLVRS